MKLAQFVPLALFGIVAAQSTPDLTNLPACGLTCYTSTTTTCSSPLDFACTCADSAYVQGVASCIQSSCTGDDVANSLTFGQGICASAGVTLDSASITASSTAASASSSAAESSSSSASSSASSESSSASSASSSASSEASSSEAASSSSAAPSPTAQSSDATVVGWSKVLAVVAAVGAFIA